MPAIENLESTVLPACKCGAELRLFAVKPCQDEASEIRIFKCEVCHHELRLMVWRATKPEA